MTLNDLCAPNRRGREHSESLVREELRRASSKNSAGDAAEVRSVGIVGAGLMGAAVAAAAVGAGLNVVITDVDAGVLAAAKKAVAAEAGQIVESRLRPTADPAEAAACDLVLESVAENPRIKKELYARLEPLLAPHSILATNTSTIPIRELAASLACPQRFCGLHFFHPVRERPMVEIIRGPQTSAAAVAAARGFADSLGKLAIEVADGPGFLVNRLLLPYAGEAMELLLDGAEIGAVERAAEAFGMPKGPLRLLDEIGLDTALQGGWVLAAAFPERIVSSPLLVGMIKAGNLGVKSGAGFFRHTAAGPLKEGATGCTSTNAELIEKWKHEPSPLAASKPLDDEAILARLLLPMVLEATRLLEDGIVSSPREIDLCSTFALGFPVERGGLLYWADSLGPRRIVEMLRPLEHLGPRMHPTKMLLEMAAAGRGFYE